MQLIECHMVFPSHYKHFWMCHIYFKDNLKEVFEVLKSKFQQTASFHSIIEARLNTGNKNINECYSMVTAIYLIARIKEKLHLPVLL